MLIFFTLPSAVFAQILFTRQKSKSEEGGIYSSLKYRSPKSFICGFGIGNLQAKHLPGWGIGGGGRNVYKASLNKASPFPHFTIFPLSSRLLDFTHG
jgi:hypothetical protein